MSALFDADLPRPTRGTLTVYLLGPGVGEAQVVSLPDGRCLVVDGCTEAGENLVAALLDSFGITSIEAAVLTHPDLDHVRGVAEVVRRFGPRKVFRYPGFAYTRDFVVGWLEKDPANERYKVLAEALDVLESHSGTTEACASTRPWTPAGAPYTLHFLAPTHFDRERVRLVVGKLVAFQGGRHVLSPRYERFLRGEAALGDAPNAISLAVVIEWCGRKVLLGGDVENGKASPKSGWKGVLLDLEDADDDPDRPRRHLVNGVDLVKVAHHGSKKAFWEAAWKRHATGTTAAILAPYSPSRLPDRVTLASLGKHCTQLGISADAGAIASARRGGWVDAPGQAPSTKAPVVAAVVPERGEVQLFGGARAAVFRRQ